MSDISHQEHDWDGRPTGGTPSSMTSIVPPRGFGALRALTHDKLGAPLEIRVGWPRASDGEDLAAWTRGGGIWLHLQPHDAPAGASALWMESSLALEIVDRALGGEGGLAMPSAHEASSLSAPERGVLAYVVARMLAALESHRLCGIDLRPPFAIERGLRCWPARVQLGAHAGAARLWSPPGASLPPLACRWVLAAEPLAAGPLCRGDVVVLETVGGRVRDGWLRLEALETLLPVRLQNGSLRVRPGPAPNDRDVTLEVQGPSMSLDDLTRLAQGHPHPYTPDRTDAWLVQGRQGLATGTLVTLDGRLALRVDAITPSGE